jgi:hypothetical protein
VCSFEQYRSEDAVTAAFRAEVVVEEKTYADIPRPPISMMAVLLFGMATALVVWYTRRLRLRQSGRHKKEEDQC